jgi:quercetin dioxygenase-like cupin family protein
MQKQPVFTRPGDGTQLNILGTVTRFLCTGAQTGKAWSLMEVTVPQGAGAPPHKHAWDEAYYVIEGEIGFVVDGRPQLVAAGDFLYAPGGTVHAFEGRSAQPARVLIFDAPAHAESFFRDVDAQVGEMPRDLGKMLAIGERHQVEFALP